MPFLFRIIIHLLPSHGLQKQDKNGMELFIAQRIGSEIHGHVRTPPSEVMSEEKTGTEP